MKQWWAAWIGNAGSLFLAVILAFAVWVNAVTTEDPDEVHALDVPVPIQVIGLGTGLIATGNDINSVRVTLRAPHSIWSRLQAGGVQVQADLTGKSGGEYDVTLNAIVTDHPVRVEKIEPASVTLSVERLATRTISVRAELSGNLAIGFATGITSLVPNKVMVTGPASFVDRVVEVVAPMSVTGLRSDATGTAQLVALDSTGLTVSKISIQPASVIVTIPIAQVGGYRDFIVKAVIIGAVQNGFRLTGMTVTPSVATLFSSNPSTLLGMPGYVETEPLDITGAKADIVRALNLKLPAGVTVVGSSGVEVQVSISAIEDSITLTRQIAYRGLAAGLSAPKISPSTVDVIVTGPLNVLKNLKPGDVEVVLDLAGYGPGTYKLTPAVHILIENLREESFSPAQVEVVISRGSIAP
jgi:YbbR domain-containing protein